MFFRCNSEFFFLDSENGNIHYENVYNDDRIQAKMEGSAPVLLD